MTDQPLVEPRERQGSERPTDPGGQLCPRWQRGGRLDLEAHRPGAWRVADLDLNLPAARPGQLERGGAEQLVRRSLLGGWPPLLAALPAGWVDRDHDRHVRPRPAGGDFLHQYANINRPPARGGTGAVNTATRYPAFSPE